MIIVEVYSPAVDASYDFQMDEDTVVRDAAVSVSEMIARKNGSEGAAEMDAALYDTIRECELVREKTLKENGVRSGMKLLLI